jgi:hypothetical protein
MDPRLQSLLDKSFHRARATDANEAIARIRQEQSGELSEALSYELMLPKERPVEHLLEYVMPRMVYFLESRGAKLPHCLGVFVSLFVDEDLYFIQAADVVAALSAWSGLSPQELVKQHGTGNF